MAFHAASGQYWCRSEVVFGSPGNEMIPASISLCQTLMASVLSSSTLYPLILTLPVLKVKEKCKDNTGFAVDGRGWLS